MGMDVYGKNKASEVGKYYRQSIWGWRPLWSYCCLVAPEITGKVRYGQSNDGDGLNDEDSKLLSVALGMEIASGRAALYVNAREMALDDMPKERCWVCGGSGKRLDPPAIGPGTYPCNGCNKTGHVRPTGCNYRLRLEDIREFMLFLAECQGFEIH